MNEANEVETEDIQTADDVQTEPEPAAPATGAKAKAKSKLKLVKPKAKRRAVSKPTKATKAAKSQKSSAKPKSAITAKTAKAVAKKIVVKPAKMAKAVTTKSAAKVIKKYVESKVGKRGAKPKVATIHIRESASTSSDTLCGGSHSPIWNTKGDKPLVTVGPQKAKDGTCGRCRRVAKARGLI